MQATLERNDKELTMTENISSLISKLDDADNKTKTDIENILVNIGENAVDELVNQLQIVKGKVRGIVAMTLIRIGDSSIDFLKKAARNNKDFEWIASYIIDEIVSNCKKTLVA